MQPTILIVLVVIFVSSLLICSAWLVVTIRGLHYIRKADWRVSVSDKPTVSGDVYRLRAGRYLVVLKDESDSHYEAYDVDLNKMRVGVPSFDPSKYTPLLWGALVSRRSLEGFPLEGSLATTWRTTERKVIVQIIGFSSELIRAGTIGGDPDVAARGLMPVAYKADITLDRSQGRQQGK